MNGIYFRLGNWPIWGRTNYLLSTQSRNISGNNVICNEIFREVKVSPRSHPCAFVIANTGSYDGPLRNSPPLYFNPSCQYRCFDLGLSAESKQFIFQTKVNLWVKSNLGGKWQVYTAGATDSKVMDSSSAPWKDYIDHNFLGEDRDKEAKTV